MLKTDNNTENWFLKTFKFWVFSAKIDVLRKGDKFAVERVSNGVISQKILCEVFLIVSLIVRFSWAINQEIVSSGKIWR